MLNNIENFSINNKLVIFNFQISFRNTILRFSSNYTSLKRVSLTRISHILQMRALRTLSLSTVGMNNSINFRPFVYKHLVLSIENRTALPPLRKKKKRIWSDHFTKRSPSMRRSNQVIVNKPRIAR